MKKTNQKLTAYFLSALMLWPPGLEAQLQYPAFKIPDNIGRIEKKNFQSSSPARVVYLIQDAHDSLEAQNNIALILRQLIEKEGVRTVYEEGYEGEVPTQKYFGGVKDPAQRNKLGLFLMDHLRISAAEFLHLQNPDMFRLIGVDNRELHKENIFWYGKTADFRPLLQRQLTSIQKNIKKIIDQTFSNEFKAWIRLRERYCDQQLDPAEYISRFIKTSPSESAVLNLKSYPNLAVVLAVRQNKNMSAETLKAFSAQKFFDELEQLENEWVAARLGTEDRKLFELYRLIERFQRLSELRLSSAEFEWLKQQKWNSLSGRIAGFLSARRKQPVVLPALWEKEIAHALRFYETAYARDEAVRKNLLKDLRDKHTALVFGGFHAGRIRQILEQEGIGYYLITPKISGASARHQKFYHDLMRGEKYDFEKANAGPRSARPESKFQQLDLLSPDAARAEIRNLFATADVEMAPAQRSELREDFNDHARVLVKSESMDALAYELREMADGQLFLHVRLRNKNEPVILQHPVTVDPVTGKRTPHQGLIDQIVLQGGILFLDASGADPKTLEPFNSLFDRNPFFETAAKKAHPNLKVIVGIPPSEMGNYANTVYSRSMVMDEESSGLDTEKFQSRFDELIQTPLPENATPQPDDIVFDLMKLPKFRKLLVERIDLENGRWQYTAGPLVHALREKKRLVIQGARKDPEFRHFIDEILVHRRLLVNGEVIEIPAAFEIVFQEKDYSQSGERKMIYRAGHAPQEGFIWLINKDNQDLLFCQTSVQGDELIVGPGLLEQKARILVAENLDDEGIWHALMHSGISSVEVADGVIVPFEYINDVEIAPRAAAEEIMPAESSNALPEFEPGSAHLLEAADLDLLTEQIRTQTDSQNTVVISISSGTKKNDLIDDIAIEDSAAEIWKFKWIEKHILTALKAGKKVVLEGMHRNPQLAKEFESLTAEVPYLMVNGQAQELSRFSGTLILTSKAETKHTRKLKNSVFIEQEATQEAYREILAREFPSLAGNLQFEARFDQIWELGTRFKKLPRPAHRGLSPDSFPSEFSLTLARLRVFFSLVNVLDGNAFEAFEHTWTVHYRKDAEIRDYLRVQAKLTFSQQESRRGQTNANQAISGKRLARLLEQHRSVKTWDKSYWQFVNTLGLAQLAPLTESLKGKAWDDDLPQEPLQIIQHAMIQDAKVKRSGLYEFLRDTVFKLLEKLRDMSQIPAIDEKLELDYLNAEERIVLAARIAAAVPVVFLQGAPGTGKSFMLRPLAERMGFSGNQIFGPFTTGSNVSQTELMQTQAGKWFDSARGFLPWDEANTAENPDFHYFLKNRVDHAHPFVGTGNEAETEGRHPMHWVREEGVTLAFDPFDSDSLREFAENYLTEKMPDDAEQVATLMIRLHEMFVRVGPQYEFSIREVQDAANRLIAFSVRPEQTDEIIFHVWLVYRDRFSPAEQAALRLLIQKQFPFTDETFAVREVNLAEMEARRLEATRVQVNGKIQGLTLVPQALSYIAHLQDLIITMRNARMQQQFSEPGKISSLILGPSGWGKDFVLESLLALGFMDVVLEGLLAFGFFDGTDPANKDKPAAQKFYLINGSMDDRELDRLIQKAKHEGSIVALREMNFLRSGILEGKLNDILAGGEKPHAGFLFIGTLNGAHFSGRNKVSSPLMSRSSVFMAQPYDQKSLQMIASDYAAEKNLNPSHVQSLANFQAWIATQIENDEFMPTIRELNRAIDYLQKNPGGGWQAAAWHAYGAVYERWQLAGKSAEFQAHYAQSELNGEFKRSPAEERLKIYQKLVDVLTPTAVGRIKVVINQGNTRSFFKYETNTLYISTKDIAEGRDWFELITQLGLQSFTRDEFFQMYGDAAGKIFQRLLESLSGDTSWTMDENKGVGTDLLIDIQTAWALYLAGQVFDGGSRASPPQEAADFAMFIRTIRLQNGALDANAQSAIGVLYDWVQDENKKLTPRKFYRYMLLAYLYGLVKLDQIKEFKAALDQYGQKHVDYNLISILEGDPFTPLFAHLAGMEHIEGVATVNPWEALQATFAHENIQGQISELQIQHAQARIMDWVQSIADNQKYPVPDFQEGDGPAKEVKDDRPVPTALEALEQAQKLQDQQVREQQEKRAVELARRRQATFEEKQAALLNLLRDIRDDLTDAMKNPGIVTIKRLAEIEDQMLNSERKKGGAVLVLLNQLRAQFSDKQKEMHAIEAQYKKELQRLQSAKQLYQEYIEEAGRLAATRESMDADDLEAFRKMREMSPPTPEQEAETRKISRFIHQLGKKVSGDPFSESWKNEKFDDLPPPEMWNADGPSSPMLPPDEKDLIHLRVTNIETVVIAPVEKPAEDPDYARVRDQHPQLFLQQFQAFYDWLTESGKVSGGETLNIEILMRTANLDLARESPGAESKRSPKNLFVTGGGELTPLLTDLFRFLFEQNFRVHVLVGSDKIVRDISSLQELASALKAASQVHGPVDRNDVLAKLPKDMKNPWLADLNEIKDLLAPGYLYAGLKLAGAGKAFTPAATASKTTETPAPTPQLAETKEETVRKIRAVLLPFIRGGKLGGRGFDVNVHVGIESQTGLVTVWFGSLKLSREEWNDILSVIKAFNVEYLLVNSSNISDLSMLPVSLKNLNLRGIRSFKNLRDLYRLEQLERLGLDGIDRDENIFELAADGEKGFIIEEGIDGIIDNNKWRMKSSTSSAAEELEARRLRILNEIENKLEQWKKRTNRILASNLFRVLIEDGQIVLRIIPLALQNFEFFESVQGVDVLRIQGGFDETILNQINRIVAGDFCKNIRKLEVKNTDKPGQHYYLLIPDELFPGFTSLEEINLQNISFNIPDLEKLPMAAKQRIKKLAFIVGARSRMNMLTDFIHLEELELSSGNWLHINSIAAETKSKIKTVTIHSHAPESFGQLAGFTTLENLRLDFENNLTNEALKRIPEHTRAQIKRLGILNKHEITDWNAALDLFPNVKELDLTGIDISAPLLEALAARGFVQVYDVNGQPIKQWKKQTAAPKPLPAETKEQTVEKIRAALQPFIRESKTLGRAFDLKQRIEIDPNGLVNVDLSFIQFGTNWPKVLNVLQYLNVERLSLAHTDITDISILLVSLKHLYLTQVQTITNWGDWSRLTQLEELDLGLTNITDISTLPASLKFLDLTGVQTITNGGELRRLTQLENLYLFGTSVDKHIFELAENGEHGFNIFIGNRQSPGKWYVKPDLAAAASAGTPAETKEQTVENVREALKPFVRNLKLGEKDFNISENVYFDRKTGLVTVDFIEVSLNPKEWNDILAAIDVGVEALNLRGTNITDISKLPDSLTSLNFAFVETVTNWNELNRLMRLEALNLNHTNINDISALPVSLKQLGLMKSLTIITNWDKLSRLTQLEDLSLEETTIADLSVLPVSLRVLSLRKIKTIMNWSELNRLTQLEDLDLDGTNIADISVLPVSLKELDLGKVLTIINWDKLSRLTRLESLRLLSTNIMDISKLPLSLKDVNFWGVQTVTNWDELSRLAQLEKLSLGNTNITNISNLPVSLKDLGLPGVNTIANWTELRRLVQLEHLFLRDASVDENIFEPVSTGEKGFTLHGVDGKEKLGQWKVKAMVSSETQLALVPSADDSLEARRQRVAAILTRLKKEKKLPADFGSKHVVAFPEGGDIVLDLSTTTISDYSFLEELVDIDYLILPADEKAAADLQKLALKNPRLSKLNFENWKIENAPNLPQSLGLAAAKFNGLKGLTFKELTISTGLMGKVAANNPNLKSLSIFNCKIIGAEEDLAAFHSLEELIWADEWSLRQLAVLVKNNPNLKYLDFDGDHAKKSLGHFFEPAGEGRGFSVDLNGTTLLNQKLKGVDLPETKAAPAPAATNTPPAVTELSIEQEMALIEEAGREAGIAPMSKDKDGALFIRISDTENFFLMLPQSDNINLFFSKVREKLDDGGWSGVKHLTNLRLSGVEKITTVPWQLFPNLRALSIYNSPRLDLLSIPVLPQLEEFLLLDRTNYSAQELEHLARFKKLKTLGISPLQIEIFMTVFSYFSDDEFSLQIYSPDTKTIRHFTWGFFTPAQKEEVLRRRAARQSPEGVSKTTETTIETSVLAKIPDVEEAHAMPEDELAAHNQAIVDGLNQRLAASGVIFSINEQQLAILLQTSAPNLTEEQLLDLPELRGIQALSLINHSLHALPVATMQRLALNNPHIRRFQFNTIPSGPASMARHSEILKTLHWIKALREIETLNLNINSFSDIYEKFFEWIIDMPLKQLILNDEPTQETLAQYLEPAGQNEGFEYFAVDFNGLRGRFKFKQAKSAQTLEADLPELDHDKPFTDLNDYYNYSVTALIGYNVIILREANIPRHKIDVRSAGPPGSEAQDGRVSLKVGEGLTKSERMVLRRLRGISEVILQSPEVSDFDLDELTKNNPQIENFIYSANFSPIMHLGGWRWLKNLENVTHLHLPRNTDVAVLQFIRSRKLQGLSLFTAMKECLKYLTIVDANAPGRIALYLNESRPAGHWTVVGYFVLNHLHPQPTAPAQPGTVTPSIEEPNALQAPEGASKTTETTIETSVLAKIPDIEEAYVMPATEINAHNQAVVERLNQKLSSEVSFSVTDQSLTIIPKVGSNLTDEQLAELAALRGISALMIANLSSHALPVASMQQFVQNNPHIRRFKYTYIPPGPMTAQQPMLPHPEIKKTLHWIKDLREVLLFELAISSVDYAEVFGWIRDMPLKGLSLNFEPPKEVMAQYLEPAGPNEGFEYYEGDLNHLRGRFKFKPAQTTETIPTIEEQKTQFNAWLRANGDAAPRWEDKNGPSLDFKSIILNEEPMQSMPFMPGVLGIQISIRDWIVLGYDVITKLPNLERVSFHGKSFDIPLGPESLAFGFLRRLNHLRFLEDLGDNFSRDTALDFLSQHPNREHLQIITHVAGAELKLTAADLQEKPAAPAPKSGETVRRRERVAHLHKILAAIPEDKFATDARPHVKYNPPFSPSVDTGDIEVSFLNGQLKFPAEWGDILRQLDGVETFRFAGSNLFLPALNQLRPQGITTLSFDNMQLDLEVLAVALEQFSDLQDLSLKDVRFINPDGLGAISQLLRALPQLDTLTLSDNSEVYKFFRPARSSEKGIWVKFGGSHLHLMLKEEYASVAKVAEPSQAPDERMEKLKARVAELNAEDLFASDSGSITITGKLEAGERPQTQLLGIMLGFQQVRLKDNSKWQYILSKLRDVQFRVFDETQEYLFDPAKESEPGAMACMFVRGDMVTNAGQRKLKPEYSTSEPSPAPDTVSDNVQAHREKVESIIEAQIKARNLNWKSGLFEPVMVNDKGMLQLNFQDVTANNWDFLAELPPADRFDFSGSNIKAEDLAKLAHPEAIQELYLKSKLPDDFDYRKVAEILFRMPELVNFCLSSLDSSQWKLVLSEYFDQAGSSGGNFFAIFFNQPSDVASTEAIFYKHKTTPVAVPAMGKSSEDAMPKTPEQIAAEYEQKWMSLLKAQAKQSRGFVSRDMLEGTKFKVVDGKVFIRLLGTSEIPSADLEHEFPALAGIVLEPDPSLVQLASTVDPLNIGRTRGNLRMADEIFILLKSHKKLTAIQIDIPEDMQKAMMLSGVLRVIGEMPQLDSVYFGAHKFEEDFVRGVFLALKGRPIHTLVLDGSEFLWEIDNFTMKDFFKEFFTSMQLPVRKFKFHKRAVTNGNREVAFIHVFEPTLEDLSMRSDVEGNVGGIFKTNMLDVMLNLKKLELDLHLFAPEGLTSLLKSAGTPETLILRSNRNISNEELEAINGLIPGVKYLSLDTAHIFPDRQIALVRAAVNVEKIELRTHRVWEDLPEYGLNNLREIRFLNIQPISAIKAITEKMPSVEKISFFVSLKEETDLFDHFENDFFVTPEFIRPAGPSALSSKITLQRRSSQAPDQPAAAQVTTAASPEPIKLENLDDFFGFLGKLEKQFADPERAWRTAILRLEAEGLGDLVKAFAKEYEKRNGRDLPGQGRSEMRDYSSELRRDKLVLQAHDRLARTRAAIAIDAQVLAGLSANQLREYEIILTQNPSLKLYILNGQAKASRSESRLKREFGERIQRALEFQPAEMRTYERVVLIGRPNSAAQYADFLNAVAKNKLVKMQYQSREDQSGEVGLPTLGLLLDMQVFARAYFITWAQLTRFQSFAQAIRFSFAFAASA